MKEKTFELNKEFNYGKLKDKSNSEFNIVYYRRGKDEMSLNLTNRCPNSCPFCIRDHNIGWNVSNLYLKKEPTAKEIIDTALESIDKNNSKITKVKICGYGEPILRLDIVPEIIEEIKERHQIEIFQLTTTG